ncbi:MAG: VWA domain-containing protein, partial [Clostridia bacterium]|nr:VWA domain-containing protein [Clostridia bacterium]
QALRRCLAPAGGEPRPPAPWPRDPGVRLAPEDLRVVRRERPRPLDLVLLIDASASMAGARMRAAQELALRLLVGSRDRVAIVSFQDRGAALRVALTRNRAALARGVAGVRPCGLTPLAAALEAAVAYLRVAHARRPLLVLITDGIPTVSRTAAGPLEDALRAAEQVARARVPFTCVGLEPNKGYLVELAERAGGTLYVVEELEGATLAEIVEGERRRRRAARA